ncbi:MAG TPA: FtsQ-type POTRA domain-containing protein [Rectinemataceae bacterium]
MPDVLSMIRNKLPPRAKGSNTAGTLSELAPLSRSSVRLGSGLAGTSSLKASSRVASIPKSSGPRKARIEEPGSPGADRLDDLLILSRPKQKASRIYGRSAKKLAQRAQASAKPEASRRSEIAKLVLAFGLLSALGIGLSFVLPEVTRIAHVSIQGMKTISEAEILQALDLSPELNLLNADTMAMKSRILANPKIEAVSIRRIFPEALSIDIVERKAIACVLVTEELGTRSIAIDPSGVAFAYLDQIQDHARLPVLSGIRFENFQPGQSLPAFLLPLLGDIAELQKLDPSPLAAFSEIKVEKISDSEAELLLYPTGKGIPIRMPSRLRAADLNSALLVLDILEARKGAEEAEEVDFRTGTIVYKTKEAQAG